MQDAELLRYSRHILLDEIGIEGQERIRATRALVIGAGGLGSPVAMYLACAGVGHITVTDHDTVDLTNLQRQIAHRTDSVGSPKVDSLKRTLQELNPLVEVQALPIRADADSLDVLVQAADVVLDCCDNFTTRHAVNAACVQHAKPLVSGAAIQFDGQISVYDTRDAQAPCYACTFPPDVTFEEARCSTMGVFAPLVGIIGSMQAAEALKLVVGTGRSLNGRLLMLDGRAMEWNEIRLPRNPSCPVCSHRPTH
ncbi:molybdopterin biosynthesis protein MoeB [Rhodoferax lacus]|uniref:Molybdopterin biosynthesis protein MoeB n=1 Tax=Rhodoferax lacus TaxID=2184758 RepID=A0A3E1RHG7_9BURK|nr:molybdopterin-synthase adenylyltransferase MoeB [Rhodoferax lacus]RFO98060.1 molybdopterin biosynthesis protein MoeB [Rhodoferax lacus]